MNIVLIGILASEIGFWVLLGAGLIARYLLRARQVSTALLLGVPVLDGVLLALLTWDMLVNDAVASPIHGLGAAYLGFTIAFGRALIARVDAWFFHRFAGGPAPSKPPAAGRARVVREWREWGRMVLCAAITCAILGVIILIVDDPARTAELQMWFLRIGVVTAAWLLGWPVWESVKYLLTGEPDGSGAQVHQQHPADDQRHAQGHHPRERFVEQDLP